MGFRGSRLEELDVVIFLSSSSERSQFGGRPQQRARILLELSKSLEAFHPPRSPRSIVFRGLSSLGACDEEVEKVKKPRTPVLFLREGVSARMLLHSMPPAGALTRLSSSGGSSSRSRSHIQETKEERRIVWFPWPPTTRRSSAPPRPEGRLFPPDLHMMLQNKILIFAAHRDTPAVTVAH